MSKRAPQASATYQPDHTAALNQIRRLADASYDTLLLADGPPQPDYLLLDLCAEGLYAQKRHEAAMELWRQSMRGVPEDKALHAQCEEAGRVAMKAVRAAAKIPATTGAGIYAKAMLARNTTLAAVLVASLAEDFINCKALRATLWPAGREGV